ncbi:hypothetical protein LEP1GSC062_2610 [Leptospira alexanderi serovar Manhao 3 str. L 60]|uniref:Uncharacterized protein n=1 Tax=Leptospira alexanderi serovar Manhao 3 str. L 60 TaxID=1049759 RepID=V6HUZ0_9LEPT|nr:hypothetical protein LEP1GSC062_2610 [Leptospira alexanderi serovar Manhao 3 str. L 60]
MAKYKKKRSFQKFFMFYESNQSFEINYMSSIERNSSH